MLITEKYLLENPNHIFVFGDNLLHKGNGGAAALRYLPNTYGFVTKKVPSYSNDAYYFPAEYIQIYSKELENLRDYIITNPDKIFLISKIGAGLANKYNIFEEVINNHIKEDLADFTNIKWLW